MACCMCSRMGNEMTKKSEQDSPVRTKSELLYALKIIVGEMKRLSVLKHWHDSKKCGLIKTPPELTRLFDDACLDSLTLTVRAIDEFFRTRKSVKPSRAAHLKTARDGDMYAETFGYIENQPLLSTQRRDEINQQLLHFTWRRTSETFKIVNFEDVRCILPHCIKFLNWLLETNFIESDEELVARVTDVRNSMKLAALDPLWGTE